MQALREREKMINNKCQGSIELIKTKVIVTQK